MVTHIDDDHIDPFLGRFIRRVRIVEPTAGEDRLRIDALPDGSANLLFRLTEGSPAAGRAARRGTLSLAGPRSRALLKATPAIPLAIAVQFHPGAVHPFLGVPASETTDRILMLEDVWGAEGRALGERILQAEGVQAMTQALLDGLASRARRTEATSSSQLARRAVRLLSSDSGPPNVDGAASALGITSRHLRRVFADSVGLAPKDLLRFARFQRALRAARKEPSWTRVAAEAGYYDQAHLIAEFHRIVGLTPQAFAARPPSIRW